MTLLVVDNLGVSFRQLDQDSLFQENVAVKGISFSLGQGETLALVGESGSGKSVTALSVLGLLPYPTAYHPSGSIQFQGMELLGQPESTLQKVRGKDIAMIFQEPMTALNPLHTIETQIGEPLEIHFGLTRKQTHARVLDLLNLVGFADGADRLKAYPHQLSGGQRQRVMIAMALACEPKLLIADEPTTALDVTIQANILGLIKSLQRQFNMALLLISHDLGMVMRMSNRIAVMKAGEIVEQGETQAVFAMPQHPYTIHLLDSEPSGVPSPLPPHADTILDAKGIKAYFRKKQPFLSFQPVEELRAVDDVSLSLKRGETLGIVGESGSGKSTLAYALLRLTELQGGAIRFDGITDLHALTMKQLRPFRRHIQIIFQDPFGSLNPRLSIEQIIAEGLTVHSSHLTPDKRARMVLDILEEVGLNPDWRHRYPHEFSGGQRQRIAIARALVLHPKLLVLDEPTSALDRSIQAEIIDLLRSLQTRHQLSYLFISHDLKVIRAMSHRIAVMKDGKIVEAGDVEKIFCHPETPYTQTLIQSAFDLTPF
ncbi:MAG: ABC transporter ATP-binding protein [Alphaproteobacteria bacterium]|nr:ABC transporter ATP-binding protein [Alphaproteobacteria bacterium]